MPATYNSATYFLSPYFFLRVDTKVWKPTESDFFTSAEKRPAEAGAASTRPSLINTSLTRSFLNKHANIYAYTALQEGILREFPTVLTVSDDHRVKVQSHFLPITAASNAVSQQQRYTHSGCRRGGESFMAVEGGTGLRRRGEKLIGTCEERRRRRMYRRATNFDCLDLFDFCVITHKSLMISHRKHKFLLPCSIVFKHFLNI